MADRVVSIKLQADASGLVQGFNRASDAANELRNKTTGAAQKVAESARTNREAWATVGTGLTAVGVAVTGLGVAALRTGVQYNTLQQTTRAALTTILGSAQAANAQMDKLDDFARNSPFAKQTFIEAQQQMLAFGIETQKVIPYLDAVQNAVAAAGGSNQEIADITRIMSQIQASSKITAMDLREFGNRGVDAATLIGSQMGKTGAQIREDITAGSLDATQALDALAAGMTQRFDGAADNVKNTFAGAMDRVKAAWRDFSAELARPLVDPDGGGALVDLLNWAADAMRAFEDLPGPIKTTISTLTGLVGVGSLVTGTAMLAIPKWLEFKDALATLGVTASTVRGGLGNIVRFLLGPWGLSLMAAAATVAVFNKSMDESKVSADSFEIAIKQGRGALEEMRSTAAQNEQGLTRLFVDVTQHAENLGPLLDKAATSGRGFFSSLTFNEQAMLDNLTEFGSVLAGLATTDLPRAQGEFAKFADSADLGREQIATALDEMPAFKNALLDYADSAGLATDDSTLLALALGEIEAEQPKNDLEELAGVATDTSDAINKLAGEIASFGETQISADRAAIKLQDELAKLTGIVNEGAAELGFYTENGRNTEGALLSVAEAAKQSAEATLLAGGSQEDANAILDDARQKLIDQRIALGENAADAEAWANARVPTANDVAAALDGVTDAANAIPNSTAANVTTDGKSARQQLNQVEAAARSIPADTPARVRAYTTAAASALSFVLGLLNDIRGGATAEVQVRRPGGNNRKNGGTIGFASGGTVPGIGGGVYRGTVFGAGTSKSDSINVNLSRGEEVIQEPFASMNRHLLKSINRGELHQGMLQGQQTVIVREIGDVYVQNPITGQYLLAQMDNRANRAVDAYVEQSAQAARRAGY